MPTTVTETAALKNLKAAYARLLKRETSPSRRKTLKEWIEQTEYKIEILREA